MSKGEKEEITQSEAAKRLGMTAQALGVWARRPGAPVKWDGGKPKCVWPDFPRWREREMEQQIRKECEGNSYDAARVEKLRLEIDEMKGLSVPADLHRERIEAFVGGLVAVVQGRLNRFEPDIVQAKTPAEARKVVEAMKVQLLKGGQEMANKLEEEVAA